MPDLEPIVATSLERTLPDARYGEAQHVAGYWTRDNRVEVDLVGGREARDPNCAEMIGSIKWKENAPFDRKDARSLQAHRGNVPLADDNTLLVGVSRQGFESGLGLDVQLDPSDIVAAWR